ncbi:MAG TPA: glycerophosphodiester phosphodiesterase family protein [Propionibacteriaceae bacterium]
MAAELPAGRVFISYRRQETAWPARQLYELLVTEFGADHVFKDVDDIEPGDDFVATLQAAVASCDVLLALIGPQWLTITDSNGNRRLDDPSDFVRLELETALGREDVRVIPILVDHATMPRPGELPDQLRPLTRRQAIEISPVTFDTRRLLNVVRDTLTQLERGPGGTGGSGGGRRSKVARRLAAVALAVCVLVLGAVLARQLDRSGGSPEGASGGTTSAASPLATPTALGSRSEASPSESSPSVPPTTASAQGATGSDVLAHRGGNEEYPLETFQSLTHAADAGFAVETDVRWTSDGKAIIVHDEAATKGISCDDNYQVSKTTWKTLRENCRSASVRQRSYPLTTYDALMDGLGAYSSWVYVEVKVDQTAAQNREFVDRIRSNGLSDRTVVTSADPDRLGEIRKLAPDLRRLLFVSDRTPVSQLEKSGLWGVAVKMDVAKAPYVRELKEAGLVVVVWTLNEESAWQQARSIGADKVLTDRPQTYAAWLEQQ